MLLCFALVLHLLTAPAAHADRVDTWFEKTIGPLVARSFSDASGIDNDPLLANWVREVGARVSKPAPRQDIRYRYSILGTDTANAFTLPGGFIFVTRGLLDTVESDDELAAVLAHEAGHVSKRHATQQIGGNLLVATLISALPRGKQYETLGDVLLYGNILRTLYKSRKMEAQADEEGIRYAEEGGYDPKGLIDFFEGFGKGRESVLEEYLSTHPSPEKRIEKAQKDPLVQKTDPAVREKVAQNFEARGLKGAAEQTRRGQDPLALPPLRSIRSEDLPTPVGEERRFVIERSRETIRSLARVRRTNRLGAGLQQLLLINSRLGDWRWVYISARAYAIYGQVGDVYARTVRAARFGPGTFDALARLEAEKYPGSYLAANAAQGQTEIRQAMERLDDVATPLTRAENAVVAVLFDLNNRFVKTSGTQEWLRYGTLEALLRYAESELARADKRSGQAWRLLAMARIRYYESHLSELIPEEDAALRGLWYDLAKRRFGAEFPQEGPTGGATVRGALAVELSASAEELEQERLRSGKPWADWVLEKKGIPENVATALRLLTFDLERETAALRQPITSDAAEKQQESSPP